MKKRKKEVRAGELVYAVISTPPMPRDPDMSSGKVQDEHTGAPRLEHESSIPTFGNAACSKLYAAGFALAPYIQGF